jgi:sialic acid synthase SpsE
MSLKIGSHTVGIDHPVYFIADIASNHNGDLMHAKELIHACAESKVDAVKMQNFNAETIVSDFGFKNLSKVKTHQSNWKASVFDSYKAASIPFEWTIELKELTKKLGMDYFTSPYSLELSEAVAPFISAFKLGSGDITWHEQIKLMSSFDKPLLIATGASKIEEVEKAVNVALENTKNIILMQCNTNYTANKNEDITLTKERFSNINLKVLETFSNLWPDVPLGLSDHTHGDLTVLGAVGLYNCTAVEKHFTLDNTKTGQDHSFSMMPKEWLSMVNNTILLKKEIKEGDSFISRYEKIKRIASDGQFLNLIIGDGKKYLSENETNTVVVQRRSIRLNNNLSKGAVLTKNDLTVLRPCPKGSLPPYKMSELIGKKINRDIVKGDNIKLEDIF